MRDDAAARVRVEDSGVQHQQLDEGSKPELPGLKDGVELVQLMEQRFLGIVHYEGDGHALLVDDPVEVV